MAAVAIRPMLPADIADVIRMERAAYQFPWTEGIFRDCLRVRHLCHLAHFDQVAAGYTVISVGAGESHLLNLCVAEAFRCRGIGQVLLRHALKQAAAHGAAEMFLEVRPSNVAAVRLYQRHDFVQIGLRRGYYQAPDGREDAIVFSRRTSLES